MCTGYIVVLCAVALLFYLLSVSTKPTLVKQSVSLDEHQKFDFDINMVSTTVPLGIMSAVGMHMGEVRTCTLH
jgi:hypothetical protein